MKREPDSDHKQMTAQVITEEVVGMWKSAGPRRRAREAEGTAGGRGRRQWVMSTAYGNPRRVPRIATQGDDMRSASLRVFAMCLAFGLVFLSPAAALAHSADNSWTNNTCRHYGWSYHGYPGPAGYFYALSERNSPMETGCTGHKASIVWSNGGAWYSETNQTTVGPGISVNNDGKPAWTGSGHSRHWGRDGNNNWGPTRYIYH